MADKRRLLIIALVSLYETEHWLSVARDRHLLTTEAASLNALARALNGLIKRPTPGR